MKIVILDKKTVTSGDIVLAPIEALGEVTAYDLTTPDLVVERVGDAEVVLCNKIVFSAEVIENCPNLKYIGLFATGYNTIDIGAARTRNIVVSNVPSYSTDAVAQHVFALLLHFLNQIHLYNGSVHNKGWIQSDTFAYFPFPIQEISGLTMGIIGYGSIGKKTAEIAKAFGMKVIVHTRTEKAGGEVEYVSMDQVLEGSDVLTIHCPLTEATIGLICKENLDKMKKSAILINTSRGAVVNEKDLAEALNKGTIAGAGLDVLTVEPMEVGNPLLEAQNCVITPHVAWAPKQTRIRLVDMVAENLEQFMKGSPIHVVLV